MKELSIKEIQSISLDILRDVHRFCQSNKISYTLFGGTMIGAIRHHGFIPWDDDIDIAMPRQDYERFIKEYCSESGFEMFCYENSNSLLAFARVCDMKKTLVVQSLPWIDKTTGVYIDVFPLDGAPDDALMAQSYIKDLRKTWQYAKLSRVARRNLSDYHDVKKKINILIRKILFRNPVTKRIDWVGRYISKCKQIAYGSTKHFANVSFMEYGMKEYQELSDYSSTVMVSFEGEQFCCCNGYDHLMRVKYGDYMQLPPLKDQVLKHGGSKYYWRDNDAD